MDKSTSAPLHTTSTAARAVPIAVGTLIGLEKRGVIGPFARDAAGRRLLTEADVAAIREYLRARGRLEIAKDAA